MLEILQYPFMQRALIAGVILGAVLAYLGIFVVLRRMAFFSDGIAHASLAGVAIGIIASFNPLFTAIIFSIIIAIIIYFIEKKTTLSTDAVIGILFTFGMALGILLISLKSGYQPELMSFLFGNILAIKTSELIIIAAMSALIFIFLASQQKKLILMSLDREIAYVSGINPDIYRFFLYVFLSIATVLGIKILGVVLVSAILITPVSTAKLLSSSFKSLLALTLIISEIVVLAGLFISYYLNLPTGPAIVICGASVFFLSLFIKAIKNAFTL